MLFTALGEIATVQIIETKRNPIYTDLIQLLNVDSLFYHKGGYLTAWGAFEILLGIQKTRMMVNHETLLMRLREATVRVDRMVKARKKVWWDSGFDPGIFNHSDFQMTIPDVEVDWFIKSSCEMQKYLSEISFMEIWVLLKMMIKFPLFLSKKQFGYQTWVANFVFQKNDLYLRISQAPWAKKRARRENPVDPVEPGIKK